MDILSMNHYRYKLNKDKVIKYFKIESANNYKASINGINLSTEYWTSPNRNKIDFKTFANIPYNGISGIVDEEIYIPNIKKSTHLNGVLIDIEKKVEISKTYTLEELISMEYEELKELAYEKYGIKGNFTLEKLREKIIKIQTKNKE